MKTRYAQKPYAPGTSRGPRRATTLLAQMADLERGDRIRELREQRHLTQPVVADRVHVTLRAYQEWEAGGGIQWENAKRLAKVLGATPDFIMSGEPRETPDLSTNGQPSQLDRIEEELAGIKQMLESSDAAAKVLADVVNRLEEAAESTRKKAPEQPQTPQADRRRKPA